MDSNRMAAVGIGPEVAFALGHAFPGPQFLDVRRDAAFEAASASLPRALRRDPEAVAGWADGLERHRPVIAACVHGHEVSQGVAAALALRGFDARYLAGGMAGWQALGLPLADKPGTPGVWVTRAKPKVDRVACPWLVRRFVDPDARVLFVPAPEVARIAAEVGGTAFDIPGAEPFTHHGEECSFDAFVQRFGAGDAALARLARIVRGADTERPDLDLAAGGLFAAALGMSALIPDDQALLRAALPLYDALYLWCRDLAAERHVWPPAMGVAR